MNIIPENLFDSIEELILNDIMYVDSNIFQPYYENTIVGENYYKYLDYLVLKWRPMVNEYILYRDSFTLPTSNNVPLNQMFPNGADFMI